VVENRSNETGDEEYKKEEIEVSCDVSFITHIIRMPYSFFF